MIAIVQCKKCGDQGKVDVGDVTTVEQAQALVDQHMSSCPWGHHIELGRVKFTVLSLDEGSAPTDEEWLATQREKGYILWTTDELRSTPIEITGFSFGYPSANIGGKSVNLDFAESPSRKRYYYLDAAEYELLTGTAR